MLVNSSSLVNTPILSLQASGPIALACDPIIDPDSLKIIAFKTRGPLVKNKAENILDARSIREFSKYGFVIDSEDELVAPDDVINIKKALDLNFKLEGLKVVTKNGAKLGKVLSYTCSNDDFSIMQLIVQRPTFKSFLDPELVVPRAEIIEVTDTLIRVKDDEKTIIERASNEDFVPNFVNPFRKHPEPDYAQAHSQTPDEEDN